MGELSNLNSQQSTAAVGIGTVISRIPQFELTATNLLLQSAAFDNASWVKTNAVIVANSTLAPNGVVEADTLNDNSGAALGEVRQNVAIANDGVQRVFSVFLLAGTSGQVKVRLLLSGGVAVDQSVDFNPVSGQIIAQAGNPTIEAITIGAFNWFRVSIPATNNNSGNTVAQCIINPASNGVGAQGTVIAWLGQLELGASPTSYIPTTTVAVARSAGKVSNWLIDNQIQGVPGASWVLIDRKVAANSASLDFVTGIDGTYDEYKFSLKDIIPALDNRIMFMRVSQDAGVSFKAGANDYSWAMTMVDNAALVTPSGAANATAIQVGFSLSNTGTRSYSGEVLFWSPAETAKDKFFRFKYSSVPSAGAYNFADGGGQFKLNALAINGIQFIMDANLILSGAIALYGLKKS